MHFKNLDIKWLGHSGFVIDSGEIIYFDPFQINDGKKADVIFITHDHYDHCSLQDIEKIVKDNTVIIIPSECQSKINRIKQDVNVQILSQGNTAIVRGVKVKAVPAYNIGKQFHQKEDDFNGYVIEVNGTRVYHAGDTDVIPEMSQLQGIDIAMLPIGGKFTMDAEEAAKAAEIIKPKIALPMHWGTIIGEKQDAERFVQLCRTKGIIAEVLEK